jgi:adenylate cyclase
LAAQLLRAIDRSSNFALGHFALGEACLFMGRFVETFDPIMRCLRLTPRDPFASLHINLIALAHYHLGDYSEAVHYSERALQSRRLEIVLRTLAASLGQLGRTDEAGPLFAELERLKPVNADRHWELTNPYAHSTHEAHFLEGLRKAAQQAN